MNLKLSKPIPCVRCLLRAMTGLAIFDRTLRGHQPNAAKTYLKGPNLGQEVVLILTSMEYLHFQKVQLNRP